MVIFCYKNTKQCLSLFFILDTMELVDFYRKIYSKHPFLRDFCKWCGGEKKSFKNFSLSGLQTSARALFLSTAFEHINKNFIAICDDEESAMYFYNDIKKVVQEVYYFPITKKNDISTTILRTEVLELLATEKKCFIVTTINALQENVPNKKVLSKKTFYLTEGEIVELDFFVEILNDYGFEQVDFVYEPGQYSLRGSIVDVFSFTSDYPFRIDFFGNQIDTIRIFDIEKQLSIERVDSVAIVADLKCHLEKENETIFEYLKTEKTIFLLNNLEQIATNENYTSFFKYLNQYPIVEFKKLVDNKFQIFPQPLFHKNFDYISV